MPERRSSLLHLQWSLLTLRHWRRSPWKTSLLITILALGVAVFFSIRLANRAAVAGFSLFSENVTGASDLILTSPSGRFFTEHLREIRQGLGNLPAGLYPILESTATLHRPSSAVDSTEAPPSLTLQVIGVDLAALPNLIYLSEASNFTPLDARDEEAETESPTGIGVFLTEALREAESLSQGAPLSLTLDGVLQPAYVAGFLPAQSLQFSQPRDLAVIDLPDLQRSTAQGGTVHRVDVRVPPGHDAAAWRSEIEARLREMAQGRWNVETPEQTRASGKTMARAFQLNLSILSCLALLVGVYLILQALEASVVRRRTEIATLRALGLSPNAIRRAWQVEALAMGLLGTLLGLALGWGIAQFTVRAIAQTVNTLYFHSTTEAASWHWGEAALAGLLGLTASALAGWLPARDAAATPPAQMLQRGNRSDGFRWLLRPSVGVALVGLALVAHQLPPWRTADGGATPWAGYLAAFLWVGGAGILAGQLFAPLARWGQKGSSRQPSRFYAASQLREATGRHRLATAGLVVAVAMAGGMSILVSSFETTVTRWLDQVMKADLFVASQGSNSQASHQRLQASLWQALWNAPEVVDGHLSQSFEIDFEAQHTRLTGIATKQEGSLLGPIWLKRPASPFLQTTPSSARTQGVISEPFAHRFQRDVGDVLVLPTPLGPQEVEVVGIYADYGNEFGNVIIPLATLHQWFQDDRVRRLSVTLREDASLEALQARWRQDHPGIVVTDQRTLRNEALRIFHQTFAVTHGLKWIGIAVAMAGLGLALASMLMERERELMTLRALGLTRKGIGQSAAWESLGMATAGLIGGLFLSLILGHLIIYVINRQSFGWTLLFQIPWREFLWLGAGLLAISALTGGFTAQRVMRVPTDQPSTRTE